MAPAPWCQSFQSTRKGQSIPTFTPPQPFQQEAFIYRDVPGSSPCRARVLPHTFLWPMDPAGSTEGQPALQRACWCLIQACSMHTAHTSSRWVSSRLGPGSGMDTAQGPNRTQTGSHQLVGEQQNGHPGLTTCALECQGLLQGKWEKKGMENAQALSKSPPAPADCSKVSPKSKALHFSVNKEGIQLCYGGSRQALSPMQVLAGTEPLQTTSGSPGEAEMGSAPHCPR